jgi:hypothetical protein
MFEDVWEAAKRLQNASDAAKANIPKPDLELALGIPVSA